MRLIRIFRIFQLSKYLRSGHTMQLALRSSRPKIIVFILYISLIVVILGTIMYIVEGQQNGFENIPKSIYWAVVTLTTVGYGDVVPITTLGKTISVFIMMLGYAIIAVPTGIVSSEFAKNRKENEQLKNQKEFKLPGTGKRANAKKKRCQTASVDPKLNLHLWRHQQTRKRANEKKWETETATLDPN